MTGCLGSVSSGFDLTDAKGNVFHVADGTSGLNQYVNNVIEATGAIDSSARVPTFIVTSVRLKTRIPPPRLTADFRNPATWHTQENRKYGLKFSVPNSFKAETESDTEIWPNFPIQDGTVPLRVFEISDVYPGTNSSGGTFRLSVNPKITNRASCEQFGRSDPKRITSSRVGDVDYAVFATAYGGLGHIEEEYYFHTFQNGLCYELDVAIDEINTRNYDMWCTIPSLSNEDEWKLIRTLLRGVSFMLPEPAVSRKEPAGPPRVNSFTATPTIASITKLHETTLAWSTQNVDYIELSYECAKDAKDIVIASDGDVTRDCGNQLIPMFPMKRSAKGSATLSFGNDHDDPIPVRITLTPFNRATPDRDLSRSVTVMAEPWNPFPDGAPTGARNMTISYVDGVNGAKSYRQGSSMTVRWTDTEKRDPCVNLFLVQDDEHGVAQYRARFGERKCQTPASGGSVSWRLADKFSGTGFRISAEATAGVSWVLGDVFEITRAN
ncbi:MAG TPA: hypothetical protein VF126_15695 [Acidobacteriaceae bacterium]